MHGGMIACYTSGPETGRPLLIVHGLYGSARNFGGVVKRLSGDRKIVTVDMRNHGESPWMDSHGYRDMAVDLAEVVDAHGGRADVLGHSMGGKAAMALALTRPETVASLIVADIAPVSYDHGGMQAQYLTAMQALDPATVQTRRQADAALAGAIADPGIRAFLLQSLDFKARRWRLNLDVLAREMPRITGWPEDLTGSFDRPTLFLSGGDSDYVLPQHRPAIRALFPKAKFAKIPGAGHWLHADAPEAFIETIKAFTARFSA